MKTEHSDPTPAMISEFLYQDRYGRAPSEIRVWKLANEALVGSSWLVSSEPAGLSAAETMNTMGNSDQISATTARPCRHHVPLLGRRRGGAAGGGVTTGALNLVVGDRHALALVDAPTSVHLFQGLGPTES